MAPAPRIPLRTLLPLTGGFLIAWRTRCFREFRVNGRSHRPIPNRGNCNPRLDYRGSIGLEQATVSAQFSLSSSPVRRVPDRKLVSHTLPDETANRSQAELDIDGQTWRVELNEHISELG